MRFLFFWSLGCTLGAVFAVEAAAWAALILTALSVGGTSRTAKVSFTIAVALLARAARDRAGVLTLGAVLVAFVVVDVWLLTAVIAVPGDIEVFPW